ncbi:porin family protein [Maribellus mangrovi]|uniref:porin family protein n=1 Tax=Maribellus mangrovi TaxID=3133146 RepID=UPI0030EB78CB
MKKICFILLMLILSFTVFSQKSRTFNNIGAIVGPGMSHILGGESWDPTFGLLLGVETNVYNINETSSIKAGVVFTLQGANYSVSYSTDIYMQTLKSVQLDEMSYSGKVSLSYIYILVLYNYISENGLYFEGEIQPGFLVSAKDEYDGGDKEDYKDAIKTFDLGIPVGAGYWINDRLSLGTRAVFGLTTIDTDESVDSNENNRNSC